MTTNKPKNTDQDLLELAAKATGYSIWEWDRDGSALIADPIIRWNPLHDDGDALRLAVRLNLLGAHSDEHAIGAAGMLDADPYAATRRAIVRAAAEIGGAKP